MKTSKTIDYIVSWIKNYKEVNAVNGFVVGVSGGIDSALTSTLCAMTGINTLCLNMPIRQKEEQYNRANKHINWLKNKFKNVNSIDIDLTKVFNEFKSSVENNSLENNLALANSRSRIRMTTLYYYAGINNSIVVGTKVTTWQRNSINEHAQHHRRMIQRWKHRISSRQTVVYPGTLHVHHQL